ncbi:MFS general substrate transporter [Aspergillus japonicus CBS 114.51]|uniref:MFS general substrate transporter n=1 Tax=Aspergillus japonicus CBS 114.51 TaxID=1448312 RepID=A0A8T8WSJ4_ASPJA|nr:MFS general substrate transporter [Aspergillus japonicus CBS 114.51]RAH78644.1 MFS general substrate transporter [Aspergillus japonicus CBS 114.51]
MNWTEKPLRALTRPPGPNPGPDPEGSELPPPPDGGLQAWTQVLCMHFVFFNSWGVSNSFSVSLLFFAGALVGRATDAGYFRLIFSLGVFLQLLGLFMLSLSKTYWQIFLMQAVCMGLGNGLTFSPGVSIMSSYFVDKRAFGVGVAAAGAATGGLIYPVLVNQRLCTQQIGFGWTIRAAGLLMLVTQMPGVVLFKPRLPPRRSGPLIEWGALTEPPFLFFTVSMFLNFWGLYFAFFYLGTFARDRLGVTHTQNLILVLNGVGIIGRIGPSLAGDRLGKLNVLIPLSVASAISGMILGLVGFATLTGPVLEGALISRDGGRYTGAQIFAGICIILGSGAALAARVAKVGWE